MLKRSLLVIGMLTVMAAPAAAGGGGCHSPATDAIGTTVDMSQFCFDSTVLRTAVGATVTWTNRDTAPHNVMSSAFPTSGAQMAFGDTFTATFSERGVYPYVCSLHPGMVGAIVVGDANTPPPGPLGATVQFPLAMAADATDEFEGRLAAVEAALQVAPAPASASPWPPLAVGLLAGVALAAVVSKLHQLS